jgi:hypothetical protein
LRGVYGEPADQSGAGFSYGGGEFVSCSGGAVVDGGHGGDGGQGGGDSVFGCFDGGGRDVDWLRSVYVEWRPGLPAGRGVPVFERDHQRGTAERYDGRLWVIDTVSNP